MPTILKTKNSVTTTVAPTSLAQGELAVNITDKKMWVGNAATTPVQLFGAGADTTFTNISVSAVATFGAGSVSAPAITTTGDTNTGIYFPAADTIAFAEGGVEGLRLNANGQTSTSIAGTASLPSFTRTGDENTGIFFPAADTIAFTEGGVESMRIDASGNVGIGRSAVLGGERLGATTSNALVIDMDSTAANGGYMRYTANGTIYGYIGTATGITGAGGTNALALRSENSMMFATGGSSERMRIDSSGNLLVGTTTPYTTIGSATFNVTSSKGYSTNNGSTYVGLTGLAGNEGLWFTSGAFRVYSSLGVGVYLNNGATSWTATSDERLKTDLKPIENATDKVNQLRSVTGRFKTDKEGTSRSFLIAQDIQKVLPEAVNVQDDEIGTLGVQYTDVIPLLVAAIKELKAQVDAQAEEIKALKG